MQTIQFSGRQWRLHSQSDRRLIFHPAKSVAAMAIAGWRKKNKLTQRAAAQRLGISQSHLAKIELGTRNPPAEFLKAIA